MTIAIYTQVRHGYHPSDRENLLYSFEGHPYPVGPQMAGGLVHASVGQPALIGHVTAPKGSEVDESRAGEWLLYCPEFSPLTAREVADTRFGDRLPTSFTPAS